MDIRTLLKSSTLGLGLAAALAAGAQTAVPSATAVDPGQETAGAFLTVVVGDEPSVRNALAWISSNWQPGMMPMALEAIRLAPYPPARLELLQIMTAHTGQPYSTDIRAWQTWWWNQDLAPADGYMHFKSALHGLLDPAFKTYFEPGRAATIDLDEAIWGGVRQDGIPPLREPAMLAAGEADYLADTDLVFGISINGDTRAYPKRILAWHEMFVDTVGGEPVAGVYCTLCGTVILYYTRHAGTVHQLGTSGFLYRSNKLMYDRATQSLWSTMRGTPVVGPLVDQDIRLARDSVVTTTWGAWRARHPDTTVLSLDTGHRRDYSEGAAYRDYFATDELMFTVPARDERLANKAEVLVLRSDDGGDPLAIASEFLAGKAVHQDRLDGRDIVVLTDAGGAHRVFEAGGIRFAGFDGANLATDSNGGEWRMDERTLTGADGTALARVPAHRAFWFGWFAAFPDTRLVH